MTPVNFSFAASLTGATAQQVSLLAFDAAQTDLSTVAADKTLFVEEITLSNNAAGVLRLFGANNATPTTPYLFYGYLPATTTVALRFNKPFPLLKGTELYVLTDTTGLVAVSGKGFIH